MEMGLGKTSVAATAFCELQDRAKVARCLVVSTKRIIQETWPEELARWDHLNRIEYQLIVGTPAVRWAKVQQARRWDMQLISFDLLKWLVDKLRETKTPSPWDMVVFDEYTKLKSPGSNRFRAAKHLAASADYVVNLGGTLVPNSMLDLWAPTFLLDGGQRLGATFTAYKARWFEPDYMGWNFTPREGAVRSIEKKLRDLVTVMRSKDYLKMPPIVSHSIEAELPPNLQTKYQALERDMLIALEDNTVVAANGAVLLGKLLQLSNGALYLEDGSWEEIHQLKLDMLEEVVDEANGESILVPYLFKSDIPRIQKRFPKALLMDAKGDVQKRWNKGEVSMMLGHPASMGHGLNLQKGGRIIAWFGLPWSFQLYEQTNARLYRQGQEKPVWVYHLMFNNRVETQVLEALKTKRSVQELLAERLSLTDLSSVY